MIEGGLLGYGYQSGEGEGLLFKPNFYFSIFFHTKNGQACEMGYYGPKAGVHILTEYGIVVGL